MYNLIEYSNYYSKIGSFWKYYRDEPTLTNAGAIATFHAANNSASFKFKQKISKTAAASDTKNIEIMVLFKYLTNCKINLILTWSETKCAI